MKQITFLLFLVLFLTSGLTSAQNLSMFDTIVHYPMINTAADLRGNYGDIELINTPYQGDDGVYCNGIYIDGGEPNGSLVRTPPIDELYDTTFAVSIEFKVDEIPSGISPVIVCGDAWRYLGMSIRWDSIAMYTINNFWYEIPTAPITTGEWHNMTCIYYGADTTAAYWYDGFHVATAWGALHRSEDDKRISNTDYGFGFTFEGYLRNLMVFSSKDLLSNTEAPWKHAQGHIYPNPTTKELIIEDVQFASWKVYSMSGTLTSEGRATSDQAINVSQLIPGHYLMILFDEAGHPVTRHRFQKM